jgi:hypothetical protein
MATIQEYVNKKYPNKEAIREIELQQIHVSRDIEHAKIIDSLEGGELDLREFKNLEKLKLRGLVWFQFSVNELEINLSDLGNLKRIDIENCNLKSLNLSGLERLEELYCIEGFLTSLNLSDLGNLKTLVCSRNFLTSIDSLNHLSNPEKLECLTIYDNNIKPTDISIFSRFVNLETLKIGTTKESLQKNKRNKFYGSLESYKNLTKLESICIEATDVDRGLEWLPEGIARSMIERNESNKRKYRTKIIRGQPVSVNDGRGVLRSKLDIYYSHIECSPHNTSAKCSAIQDQLRPYDYDLEAWQLAHPHLMYTAQPELFQNPKSKEKWLKVVEMKIKKTKEKLEEAKQIEGKEKKVKRLESKIRELNLIKENVLLKNKETSNKETQTDLTGEQIEKAEELSKQLQQVWNPKNEL